MLASRLLGLVDLLLPVDLEVVAAGDRPADDESRPSVGEGSASIAAAPAPTGAATPSTARPTPLSLSLALSVIMLWDSTVSETALV